MCYYIIPIGYYGRKPKRGHQSLNNHNIKSYSVDINLFLWWAPLWAKMMASYIVFIGLLIYFLLHSRR